MVVTHRQIIAKTGADHGVTVNDILGRSALPDILAARYAALAACHEAFPNAGAQELSAWFRKDRKWAWRWLRRNGLQRRTKTIARAA